MKTTLELLRERLLKDKEIFPHYNEYINGILYDIDNELLAMEKEMMNKNIKFICHGCGTKHTGENDDQMYEVCKQCFTNL